MAKANKGGRRRGENRGSGVASTVHYVPSPAGSRVFAIEELTVSILCHLPDAVLLSKSQRVCQQWRAVAQKLLQPLLSGVPAPCNRPPGGSREINALLLDHFGTILSDGSMQLEIGLWLTGHRYSSMRSLVDLPMATSGPGRAVHDAYARVGASWRGMQIYRPPVYELRYRREVGAEIEVVKVADGVRLGQVCDVLVAITGRTKGLAWNEMRVTWPQASTGRDDKGDAGSGESETVRETVRDYILLEKVRHVLPAFCECFWGGCRNERRCLGDKKRKMQLIASNKWRVTSKEFMEEDLLVQI